MQNWRPIPGYESCYSVSDDGVVIRTATRPGGKPRRHPLSLYEKNGYRAGHLAMFGKNKGYYVHRLVWLAFNGPIPEGVEINHIDGNRQNNKLENLELLTRSENVLHGVRVLGRNSNPNYGIDHHQSKFTEDDIVELFRLSKTGMSNGSIAEQFGVSSTAIWLILHGKNWRKFSSARGLIQP